MMKIWLLSVNFEKFTSLTYGRSVHKFIEVNFSKLTDSNQIFRNDLVCM